MKLAGHADHSVLRDGVERKRGALAGRSLGRARKRVFRRERADNVAVVAVTNVRLRVHGDGSLASGEAVSPALPFICALQGAHWSVPLLTWLGARDG